MFRKLLVTAFVILFAATVRAGGQDLKIGYMNPQEVLSQIPERAEVQQKLNNFVEQKRTALSQKSTDFQEAVSAYQDNAASMSEEQQQKREDELSNMEQELMNLRQNIQQQVQQRQAQLMSPIYNRMDQAIAAVAKANDLDFVINEETSYGDTIIYYASDQKLDITQEVLNRMQSQSDTTTSN